MEIFKKALRSNDIVKVLRVKPFFFLMLSEFFSQIAFNMQHFVIIFIIYEIYKTNSAVSGVILSFTIPAVLFSIIAGVYVDRWDKKKVLFAANFFRGILLLLFLIPNTQLLYIYMLTFFLAIATQFFLPAEAPMIPLLVRHHLSIAANAIFGMGIFTTVLIGYILAGPFLLLFGKFHIFIFLSAMFFLSAIFILFIKNPKRKKKKDVETISTSISKEFVQALSFLTKTKAVLNALFLLTFAQTIIFVFAALGPGYVSQILDVQVESLSWILLAPAAFGMIAGSVFLGSLPRKTNIHLIITVGFFLAGLVFIFLPFGSKVESYRIVQFLNMYLPHVVKIDILHIIIFLAFLGGIANSFIFVPSNSVIQKNTHSDFRGRIYGLLHALVGGVSLIPVAAAGGLADVFGVGRVLTALGILILSVGAGRLFFR